MRLQGQASTDQYERAATRESRSRTGLAQDKGCHSKGGFLNNILFMNNRLLLYTPLISLHKYRTVYENNILFRKPPLLGPPLSLPQIRTGIGDRVRSAQVGRRGIVLKHRSCLQTLWNRDC